MISESFSYDSPVSVASKHFEDELVRPQPEHCKVVRQQPGGGTRARASPTPIITAGADPKTPAARHPLQSPRAIPGRARRRCKVTGVKSKKPHCMFAVWFGFYIFCIGF